MQKNTFLGKKKGPARALFKINLGPIYAEPYSQGFIFYPLTFYKKLRVKKIVSPQD
jgi:hypothetical protein